MIGGPSLSIVGNHISEFAARRDVSGTFVCSAMWGFGLSYLATAAVLIRWRGESTWVRWGCLCLAAAASLLPFVAEYRLWVPPPHEPGFWDWLIGKKLTTMPADWSVRQQVHGNAISASMLWAIAGMIFVGIGARYSSSATILSKWSWRFAIVAFVLFWGCNHQSLAPVKGLIELLAFVCIAAWLVVAIRSATDVLTDSKTPIRSPVTGSRI